MSGFPRLYDPDYERAARVADDAGSDGAGEGDEAPTPPVPIGRVTSIETTRDGIEFSIVFDSFTIDTR